MRTNEVKTVGDIAKGLSHKRLSIVSCNLEKYPDGLIVRSVWSNRIGRTFRCVEYYCTRSAFDNFHIGFDEAEGLGYVFDMTTYDPNDILSKNVSK